MAGFALAKVMAMAAILLAIQSVSVATAMVHSFDLIPIVPNGGSNAVRGIDEYAMTITIGSPGQTVPVLPAMYINSSATLNVPTTYGCQLLNDTGRTNDCLGNIQKAGPLYDPLKDVFYQKGKAGPVSESNDSWIQWNVAEGVTKFTWKPSDDSDLFDLSPVSISLFNSSTLGVGIMSLDTFMSGSNSQHIDGQPQVDVLSIFTGHGDRTGCVVMGGYDDNMIDHDNMGVWENSMDSKTLEITLQALTIAPNSASETSWRDSLRDVTMHGHQASPSMDFDHASGPVTFPCDNTTLNLVYDSNDMRLPEKALQPILSLLGDPDFDPLRNAYKLPEDMSRLNNYSMIFHFANDTGPVHVKVPVSALISPDPQQDNPLTPRLESGQTYLALTALEQHELRGYLGRVFLKYVYLTHDRKNGRFHMAAINASAPTNSGRQLKQGSPVIWGQNTDDEVANKAATAKEPPRKLHIGALIGGIVAIVVLLLLVLLAVWHCVYQKRKKQEGSLRSTLISGPFPAGAAGGPPPVRTSNAPSMTLRSPPMATPAVAYAPRRMSNLWLQRPGYPSEHETAPDGQHELARYGVGAGESSRAGGTEFRSPRHDDSGFTDIHGRPSSVYHDESPPSDYGHFGHPLDRNNSGMTPLSEQTGFRPSPLIVGAAAAGLGVAALKHKDKQTTHKQSYSLSSDESHNAEEERLPPSLLSPSQHRQQQLSPRGYPFPTVTERRLSSANGSHSDGRVSTYLVGDPNVSSIGSPRRLPNVVVRERELLERKHSSLTAASFVTAEEDETAEERIARTVYAGKQKPENGPWNNKKQQVSPTDPRDSMANNTAHQRTLSDSIAMNGARQASPPRHLDYRRSSVYSLGAVNPHQLNVIEGKSPTSSIIAGYGLNSHPDDLHLNGSSDPPGLDDYRSAVARAFGERQREYTLSQSSRYLPIFPPPSLMGSQSQPVEPRRVPRRSDSVDSNPYAAYLESTPPIAESPIMHPADLAPVASATVYNQQQPLQTQRRHTPTPLTLLPSTRYVPPAKSPGKSPSKSPNKSPNKSPKEQQVQQQPPQYHIRQQPSNSSSLYDDPSVPPPPPPKSANRALFSPISAGPLIGANQNQLDRSFTFPPKAQSPLQPQQSPNADKLGPLVHTSSLNRNGHGASNYPYNGSYHLHSRSTSSSALSRNARTNGLDERFLHSNGTHSALDIRSGAASPESMTMHQRSSSRISAVRDFQYPGRPIRRFVAVSEDDDHRAVPRRI
jgi:hypothetical protein